uniref:Cytochrome c oxidase subunit 2 n=1 Tax=Megalyra sp. MM-2014 TaxID=1503221 RepID=A0A096XL89_9HYME|nr:cytochrome c oxidase subunit II [Megalyra sp. MM-2014]
MMNWLMFNFQDGNSPFMENMIWFHDYVMMILVMIVVLVMYMYMIILKNKFVDRNMLHGSLIEIIWTLIPFFIMLFMAIPSLSILYFNDELLDPVMTIKVMGHQWYWSYEYAEFIYINFDSFMLSGANLSLSNFRLLDVDNHLILPIKMVVRLLISSVDVIHSWAVPSLGVKMDASPGRLNQVILFMFRPGLFFGQCSEICGMNHSFMPIVVEAVDAEYFTHFLVKF